MFVVTLLVLIIIAIAGSWLVHQADRHFELSSTCRYRDFHKLRRRADHYSVSYTLTGLMALFWFPLGALVSLWVFGYAAYRRLS